MNLWKYLYLKTEGCGFDNFGSTPQCTIVPRAEECNKK